MKYLAEFVGSLIFLLGGYAYIFLGFVQSIKRCA